MCVCVWECFVLNCFLPCYSASFKQEHVHLSSIIPCRDSSLIGSEFEKVLAQLLCNIFLIEWCVSLTSKIFKARLKCFVLLSIFSLLCPTNKPPDSRHSQLHFHINTFPWPGMRAHAVSAVSGSICPAPSPICCLPACQSEAALWRSHAAGLPLNIIIVHYYGVSFLIHYYVIFKHDIKCICDRRPFPSQYFLFSDKDPWPAAQPGSRLPQFSSLQKFFAPNYKMVAAGSWHTHQPPAFHETLFWKTKDVKR